MINGQNQRSPKLLKQADFIPDKRGQKGLFTVDSHENGLDFLKNAKKDYLPKVKLN
jgi:hypothetical protein